MKAQSNVPVAPTFDEVLEQDLRDPSVALSASRREFLAGLGGGILVLFWWGEGPAEGARGGGGSLPSDWNAFVRVGTDGRVTAFTGKVELGQGTQTALLQVAAEELNVPLDSCDIVMSDTDLCPYDMGTFGSMSIRIFSPRLRDACAEARGVLLALASEKLGVPAEQLSCRDGKVCVTAQPRRALTFASLTQGQRIERRVQPKPDAPAAYTVVGKPTRRRDGVVKVTGEAKYSGDMRPPGLLYGRVLRPPMHGAKLKQAELDVSAAKAMPGVQVVQDGDFVAVVAEKPDLAQAALGRIKAAWETPQSNVDDRTIFDHLVRTAGAPRGGTQGGDLAAGEKAAVTVFDEKYTNAYVAHMPMEPHTATVHIEGSKATVWASTQRPFGCRDEVAQVLGEGISVRCIAPYVGGGFGGKSANRQAVEAARLAKATGKPVQVAWTREEEVFYDTFRPAAVVTIRSGVDGEGKITFWDYVVYNAGERGAPHFYAIPNHRTRSTNGQSPLATGAWRAPGNNTNCHARESQIDIMAAKAGIDPLEFRLRNLAPDHPVRRCLLEAAKQFGYQPSKAPSRRGIGIACGTDVGTWVAHIAQVEVDRATGRIQVKRVVVAQDMGLCVNPEGTKMQMEGCVTMGLGYALKEEIRFTNGGDIRNLNFAGYPITLFSEVPKIETVVLDTGASAPQGGGEPAIIVMGALIANAVHDALGVRIRHLPITPERVLEALKA